MAEALARLTQGLTQSDGGSRLPAQMPGFFI